MGLDGVYGKQNAVLEIRSWPECSHQLRGGLRSKSGSDVARWTYDINLIPCRAMGEHGSIEGSVNQHEII